MEATETLEAFYKNNFIIPQYFHKGIGHFNVFDTSACFQNGKKNVQYSRREFYKISLVRGDYRYHYADKSIAVSGSTLMFHNPHVPYTWELTAGELGGFFCIFTDSFLRRESAQR
ncbi:hypothetical protein [Flavobacterium sp. 3HN19-14]|uniref:hypothetical protein n=1 Tax=Flavobacterium sp. 3HN19-14 TaxID=3448133 RepID=UPI003EE06280